MAIFLKKSLFVLPLLLISGSSLPFPHFFNFSNGDPDLIEDTDFSNGNWKPISKADFETGYMGDWKLDNPNVGVSSMQFQLLPNNKVIMFDTTNLGPSALKLRPNEACRPVPNSKTPGEVDCWAHAIEYDIETKEYRPLKLLTDAWCSSGGVTPNGTLISTGGWKDGGRALRTMAPCDNCDWKENPAGLASYRWYSTQEKLEDGTFVLFGGRREFNYEFVQNSLSFPNKKIDLPFLKETTDAYENNLYPFAYLLPDGNVFLLANNRAVILQIGTGKIVRELPVLPGGSRNYPASGMSALLPLKVKRGEVHGDVEVLVCGGNQANGMPLAEKGRFLPALQDCGRINVMDPKAKWEIEMMPSRRVMGDMLLLPNGEILILNGAMDGTSGWNLAENPNLTPVLYSPNKKAGQRFKNLKATNIPRMYHASSGVLPDGTVLVAGSNTHQNYILSYKLAKFPTELRVERFYPPYLDPELNPHRPIIVQTIRTQREIKYGSRFTVDSRFFDRGVDAKDVQVTLLPPPFTTHGYSQNQRLVVLHVNRFFLGGISVTAPSSGKIAPPGYYILYVVHRGVPSQGMWVKLHA